MKRCSRMKTLTLSLFTLIFFLGAGAAHALPTDLSDDHYILVTIPAESAEEAHLLYWVDGGEEEFPITDGEVVNVVVFGPMFAALTIPFSAFQVADDFRFQLADPAGPSSKPLMVIESLAQAEALDKDSMITVHAPDATVEIRKQGDPEGEIILEPPPPIVIDPFFQDFLQEENMEFRFVVESPEEEEAEGEAEAEPEEEEEPGEEPQEENQELDFPGAGATGGCSLTNVGGKSNSMGWFILLASLTFLISQYWTRTSNIGPRVR